MALTTTFRALERSRGGQRVLFGVGVVLAVVAGPVGLLPGPGGFPLFLAGLTLMLRYSRWAKRRYVALKRRWPKQGALADWGLRRRSAKRRADRLREDG